MKYIFAFTFLILLSAGLTQTAWAQEGDTQEVVTEKTSQTEEKAKESNEDKPSGTPPKKAPVKIYPPVDIFQQTQSDIKHYLHNQNVQPLLAGPDDYLTLIEESHTAINKGVAILLPDFPIGATTPKSINYLRKVLPIEGWTTITIQPSYGLENYPSKNIDEEQRLKENKDALLAYQAKLAQLIPAVMEKAKAYPGVFLVIAEGTHAAILTNVYQKDPDNTPSAFVLLSAYLPSDIEGQEFANNMVKLEMPILDLVLKHDHPLAIKNSKLRKKLAQKELKVYYRQQQITNLSSSYYPSESLLKAINGWLRRTGW